MAAFLLDENISPDVADQVKLKDSGARIVSLHHWREGELISAEDAEILTAALDENLTLITYDLKSIVPLVRTWAEDGRSHAGVIFVDGKSIANNDYGTLVEAILEAWARLRDVDFTDGVTFLRPGS